MKSHTLSDWAGNYGQPPRQHHGVITEHVHVIMRNCKDVTIDIQRATDGTTVDGYLVQGDDRFQLLCSEVINVYTEDGPVSGRCGHPVFGDRPVCEMHRQDHHLTREELEDDRYRG